jgi:YVTN family beta-propeller protein
MTAHNGSLWISDFDASVVRRVDGRSGRVTAKVKVGPNPEDVLVAHGSVWVANHRGGTVSRVDPKRSEVSATIKVGPAGPLGATDAGS